RVTPSKISYNAAISACGKNGGGKWQVSLDLLGSMADMRLVRSTISFNAAISASAKAGQWQLALRLLSSMPSMMVSPNEISYSSAIDACEKGVLLQTPTTGSVT
ncbi:unnamed protein product, partial [Polarella glacialis]